MRAQVQSICDFFSGFSLNQHFYDFGFPYGNTRIVLFFTYFRLQITNFAKFLTPVLQSGLNIPERFFQVVQRAVRKNQGVNPFQFFFFQPGDFSFIRNQDGSEWTVFMRKINIRYKIIDKIYICRNQDRLQFYWLQDLNIFQIV